MMKVYQATERGEQSHEGGSPLFKKSEIWRLLTDLHQERGYRKLFSA